MYVFFMRLVSVSSPLDFELLTLLPVLHVLFIEYGCCIFIGLKASCLIQYLFYVMPLSYSLSSNL